MAKIFTLTALLILAALAAPASAETPSDYCIEQVADRPALRKDASRPSRDRSVPYSVPGLPVEISDPSEGGVTFRDPATGHTTYMLFPSGDDNLEFTYYDAAGGRLYGDSFFEGTGWIQFREGEAGFEPTDSGLVRPRLNSSPVNPWAGATPGARYSPALRLGFYTGYTTWWCCKFLRQRRTFEFDLDRGKGRRIPDFWWLELKYVGDDPVTGRAVLEERGTWHLYWHDGERVFRPHPDETGPLLHWVDDPLSDGQLLRGEAGRPWRFENSALTPLNSARSLGGEAKWIAYRPAFDRWIIGTSTGWHVYEKGRPLTRLAMPEAVEHENLIPGRFLKSSPKFPHWIITRSGIWWEEENGASPISMTGDNTYIAGPADVDITMDGNAIAFGLATEAGEYDPNWYILRHKHPSETCTLPDVLTFGPQHHNRPKPSPGTTLLQPRLRIQSPATIFVQEIIDSQIQCYTHYTR